jgi:hypothetical protein
MYANLHRIVVLAAAVTLTLASAGCAKQPAASNTPTEPPSKVDKEHKTVHLSQKASERLQIELVSLTEQTVFRTISVGAEVVGSSKSASVVLLRANLNAADAAAVDPKKAARVRAIGSTDQDEPGEEAELSDAEDDAGMADDEDDDKKLVYFRFKGNGKPLQPGQRASVEYVVQGSEAPRRALPYSALIYDLKGDTWVYVATGPLTFQRQKVTVDFFRGQTAYLSEGPPTGALIVVSGPAELYGAETGVGK